MTAPHGVSPEPAPESDAPRIRFRQRIVGPGDPSGAVVSYPGGLEVVTEPLDDVIDSENFTPRLLALISNALVRRESQLMLRAFSLGTNDWRVISALAIRPAATSTEITEFLAMNKALVSKSVNTLIERELVVPADGPRGSRPLYLTRSGADMHAAMKPISLGGQDILLAGLTPDERLQLNELLRRVLSTTTALSSSAAASSL